MVNLPRKNLLKSRRVTVGLGIFSHPLEHSPGGNPPGIFRGVVLLQMLSEAILGPILEVAPWGHALEESIVTFSVLTISALVDISASADVASYDGTTWGRRSEPRVGPRSSSVVDNESRGSVIDRWWKWSCWQEWSQCLGWSV